MFCDYHKKTHQPRFDQKICRDFSQLLFHILKNTLRKENKHISSLLLFAIKISNAYSHLKKTQERLYIVIFSFHPHIFYKTQRFE